MQESFGIRDESVFKAASGLHGGIGGKGDVCGSLMGASLMLGMMCGSSIEESGKPKEHFNPAEIDLPTRLVGELYEWFDKEFGTVKCRKILSQHKKEVAADPNAKGLTKEERMGRIHAKCGELCGKTAARTAEILWDALNKGK